MQIAVASGKGGTGKTTIAVNLALSLDKAQLLDCDVEEPNCNVFLNVGLKIVERVQKRIPVIDKARCTRCGECSRFCRRNALAVLPNDVLFFGQLCNGCGGCTIVCPEKAISEVPDEIGVVEVGKTNGIDFVRGLLNIGQPMATPVISAVKKRITGPVSIVDVPPGTGCPVIECLNGSDFVILVTEPTPFGLADLQGAVELTRVMGLKCGVVVNRQGIGDDRVERYCRQQGVPLLMTVPESMDIARAYSEGTPFVKVLPDWRRRFQDLFGQVEELVA
jgi:MinD superfamily P-loop ATPase